MNTPTVTISAHGSRAQRYQSVVATAMRKSGHQYALPKPGTHGQSRLPAIKQQRGAVSLLTALVLLISITLVTVLTSKTVLVETQRTADNSRTSQAAAAASAAMDQGAAYFLAGGVDQRNNGTGVLTPDDQVDFTDPGAEQPSAEGCAMPAATTASLFSLNPTDNTLAPYAQFYFENNEASCCGATPPNKPCARLVAKGWSDDCMAARTISQCVSTFDVFDKGKGPQQSFISRAAVGGFGNATIINRYNNSNIWTGGSLGTSGAAFGTYLRPSGTEIADYTATQLDSDCEASPCNDADNPGPNTQLVSDRNSGYGIDVIDNDPTISSKTPDQFFDMFFAHTKAEIRQVANDNEQLYTSTDDALYDPTNPQQNTGVIWVDENNATLNAGDQIGSPTTPAILIVNGNLTLNGGATIYGVLYITGTLSATGGAEVKGSVIAESGNPAGLGGSLKIVYKPWGSDGTDATPTFLNGTGAIIPGSWKDW